MKYTGLYDKHYIFEISSQVFQEVESVRTNLKTMQKFRDFRDDDMILYKY